MRFCVTWFCRFERNRWIPSSFFHSEKYHLALEREASPIAGIRDKQFPTAISRRLNKSDAQIITRRSPIILSLVEDAGFPVETVFVPLMDRTTSEDTVRACQLIEERGASILLFTGGDGTSIDVISSGVNIPVLGVPCVRY